METYLLITNTSGCKYWSYLVHNGNACGSIERNAVEKYGVIFVNRNGGYFTPTSVDIIHKSVVQDRFPDESEESI